MAEENKALTPRETSIRMLEHMYDDVSYDDIIRQLHILQQIEWVMTDVETAGSPPEMSEQEDVEDSAAEQPMRFAGNKPSIVLRSGPMFCWLSLAERSDDGSDSVLMRAAWIY